MRHLLTLIAILYLFSACNSYEESSLTEERPLDIRLAPVSSTGVSEVIPVNAQIILHVSSEIDPQSLTQESLYIEDSQHNRLFSEISLTAQTILLKPLRYLPPDADLFIIATTSIQTREGKSLSKEVRLSFRSGPATGDTTPPLYLGDSFSYNANPIHPDTVLYFQFDEAISPLGVTDDTIRVYIPDPLERVPGTVGVLGSLLYFRPDQPFSKLTSPNTDAGYGIYLDINGSLTDLSGNVNSDAQRYFEVYADTLAAPLEPVLPINTDTYDYDGTVYSIENNGSTLFLGGDRGLQLCHYDSTVHSFTPLSTLMTPEMGEIYAISQDSELPHLYLATSKGVAIIDISDLKEPEQIGFYPTETPVYGVDRFREHLYLAATLSGMVDLNISTPSTPRLINTYPTQGIAFSVLSTPSSGYGDYVSLSDFDKGMVLVDPANDIVMNATFNEFYGQIRAIIPDQNDTTSYLALSSVGGVYRYDLQVTPPPLMSLLLRLPSYAYKIISRRDQKFYVSLKGMGIALIDYQAAATITRIFTPPFEVTSFAYITEGMTGYLIIPDKEGALHVINAN